MDQHSRYLVRAQVEHNGNGNIALADGSVQQVTSPGAAHRLAQSAMAQSLAIPLNPENQLKSRYSTQREKLREKLLLSPGEKTIGSMLQWHSRSPIVIVLVATCGSSRFHSIPELAKQKESLSKNHLR